MIDAIAVANYFVRLALDDGVDLGLLGLVKRVYIAHGYHLALYDKPLLDYRFDRVEAWRYGPVIPSVYHTFKHHKKNPIKEYAEVASWQAETESLEFFTPILEDKRAQEVCRMVWRKYKGYSGSDLVTLTHKEGTPWSICYVEGENLGIPDRYTQAYYTEIVELARKMYAEDGGR